MNIVYSSSDAYAECTGVSLWSLYEKNKHIKELNVYILDTDISDINLRRLQEVADYFGRPIVFIKASDGFAKGARELNLPLLRGSYNTYSRVIMNTWFDTLDKVFVIDSDTLVTGDIEPIWNIDIADKLIGAVPEVAMYGKYNSLEDPDIIRNVPMYYNMGMCLINLREWRKRNIDAVLRERITADNPKLMIADQSIINKYLNNDIERLLLKYNYYSVVHDVDLSTLRKVFPKKDVFNEYEYNDARCNPSIIHYFGHSFERPWFKHNAAYMRKEYLTIRNRTPWKNDPLRAWQRADSRIIQIYDIITYLLMLMGARKFALKFRYVYGQRIKMITGVHR